MDTDLILLEKFAGSHPLMAAQTIDGFPEEEIAAIIDEFPLDLLVSVVNLMNRYKIAKCLKLVKSSQATSLIEKMNVQASELILRLCEEDLRNEILSNVSTKLSFALRLKLKHRAFTIGSLMNPLVVSFKKDQTVKEAIALIKQEKQKSSAIFPVINDKSNLEGMIKIQDLFLSENKNLVETVMIPEIPKFSTDLSIESVANHPEWYEYQSIPVVDHFNKLVGMLDFETVHKHNIKSGKEQTSLTAETAKSLGELYRVGLNGFLHSIGS